MGATTSRLASTVLLGLFLATPAVAQLVFTDITDLAGVGLDDLLVESVAWGDYDNDGDEDPEVDMIHDIVEPTRSSNRILRVDSQRILRPPSRVP